MVKNRVVELVESTDPKSGRWRSLVSAARMAYETGQLRQAESLLARARELAHGLPESEMASHITDGALGAVYLASGRAKEARKQLSKTIDALQSYSDEAHRELLAVALRFYAQALLELGDERDAEKALQKSAAILSELGSGASLQYSYTLCDLAGLYLHLGRFSEADKQVSRAITLVASIDDLENPVYTRACMISKVCQPMDEGAFLETASDSIQAMIYTYGSGHPNISRALSRYFQALQKRGDKARIEETCSRFGIKAK